MKSYAFEVRSALSAPPAAVWAHATSLRGVNREFFPLLRMTYPRGFESIALDEPEVAASLLGKRLFRSWILAGLVLPIDYDDLTVAEYEAGRRFLERSSMLTQREWQHERVVDPLPGGGTSLTDRVRFIPRIGVPGWLFLPMYRLVFRYRHRNLRRLFGS